MGDGRGKPKDRKLFRYNLNSWLNAQCFVVLAVNRCCRHSCLYSSKVHFDKKNTFFPESSKLYRVSCWQAQSHIRLINKAYIPFFTPLQYSRYDYVIEYFIDKAQCQIYSIIIKDNYQFCSYYIIAKDRLKLTWLLVNLLGKAEVEIEKPSLKMYCWNAYA